MLETVEFVIFTDISCNPTIPPASVPLVWLLLTDDELTVNNPLFHPTSPPVPILFEDDLIALHEHYCRVVICANPTIPALWSPNVKFPFTLTLVAVKASIIPITPPVDYNPLILATIVEFYISVSFAEPINPPTLISPETSPNMRLWAIITMPCELPTKPPV